MPSPPAPPPASSAAPPPARPPATSAPTPDDDRRARFTALFDRVHAPLLAYAVRRVADPADAADVVAETFLVAWRRLDDVPAGDAARPWLFGVARRVLANHYRGERRRLALADRLRDQLDEVVAPPEPVDPTLVEAMDRLPPDDRELLRLVAWEELARDEIALVLGVPRATVRVRLHRARRRLVAQLAALEEPDPPPAAAPARDAPVQRTAGPGHVSSGWATARPGPEEAR
ncbi:RNA polymerase sigma factor [Cellulomonas iranensis]|uniref:RNA polymerase sigma factor n=1 Tax=Cellulomonas iranensis TaxID=76862 RepID=UPI0023F162C4|nr:sigma-70 family RNA polymerase sigma factor [Cellulomonas iranensis]